MRCFTSRFLVVLMTLTIVALLGAGVAMAQGAEPPTEPQVPTLPEALSLLASGVGVGAVVSFLFVKFKWFNDLPGATKSWIVFGVSLFLPLAATASLQFIPAEILAELEPYWRAVALGFLTWAGSQATYLLGKRPV